MDKDRIIEITKREVKQDLLTCIDFDRNIWIKQGFPIKTDTGMVDSEIMKNLSGPPYVFKADVMNLFDIQHPKGIELRNVNVIFMHGGRREDGDWMFSDIENGYPVVETVKAVNEYLKKKGEAPIEIVMACNKFPASEITIGDFDTNENIVYAVGETVGLMSAGMSEEGEIHFNARAGSFWGLDKLAISQQIEIL